MLRETYIRKIQEIPDVSFNREQKIIAKKIIMNADEKDLDAIYGLISKRVKTGFVFDEAPEVNHNAIALIKENPSLFINTDIEKHPPLYPYKQTTIEPLLDDKPFLENPTLEPLEHKLIIGENYDALKNLCAIYIDKNGKGLIDVIYIDPPYNTEASKAEGNDYKDNVEASKFIYRDKYTRDGWLNMMNERLKLARRLLSDKGVIFISIDDSEQAYLKVLCDEIFGEENFVAFFPWRKRTAKSDVPFGISQDYESILCFAKSNLYKSSIEGKERKYYETPDFPGRPWRIHDMTTHRTAIERPNSFFTMVNPKTGEKYECNPNRTWRITKDTFKKYYEANEIIFPGDYDFLNIKNPVARYFKDKDMAKDKENFGKVAVSTKLPDNIGMSQDGTKEIIKIFGDKVFNFPKPSSLIKFLIKISSLNNKSALVLDFFAGSGTTGQAVMELNAEDGGKRQFILVTNNENGIGEEITWERLYRVINGKGSKGEEIKWKYSEEMPCLYNNNVRVFNIEHHKLSMDDLETAEKLKNEAREEFKKLYDKYNASDLDIYYELSSLNPYKSDKEEENGDN